MTRLVPTVYLLVLMTSLVAGDSPAQWRHLSSARGELPVPAGGPEQTACVVGDFDANGRGDFVIASRDKRGRIELWRSLPDDQFDKVLIETADINPEAGGAAHDIDDDGDLDLVLAQDNLGRDIFWWENPAPNFGRPWTRRTLSTSAGTVHHDQLFADVDHDGQAELVSWNQGSQSLLLFEIPKDPRGTTSPWAKKVIYKSPTKNFEGLAFHDIDGDGKGDLVGAGLWWKFNAGTFTANVIDGSASFTRVAVGQLVPGGRPEVVFAPGDAIGTAYWYQWNGTFWTRTLLSVARKSHTLEISDFDGDGNLDVLLGEMQRGAVDCQLMIFRGDGKGVFQKQVLAVGNGIHEGKLVDLDQDGDLDIIHKPYDDGTPRIDVWLSTRARYATNLWTRTQVARPLQSQATYAVAGDIDGDGWSDVAAGDSWWRNPGTNTNGTWTRAVFDAPLRNVAALVDLDGDGDLDAFGTQGVGSTPNASFAWAENDGAARFRVHTNIPAGKGDFLQGVAVARFAGPTGPLQIALSWHQAGSGVQLLTVPVDPVKTRWNWSKISDASQDEDLSAGDIDGDGDLDLFLGTRWLENPSWTAHTIGKVDDLTKVGGTPTPDRNELADMDGDGDLDAVVALENGREILWFENPRRRLPPTQAWPRHVLGVSAGQGFSMDVADLDRDGDPDVVVGEHRGAIDNRVLLFRNDGALKPFTMSVIDTGPATTIDHHDGTRLHDMDGDGDLDLFSVGWTHPKLWMWTNGARSPSKGNRRASAPIVTPAHASFVFSRIVRLGASSTTATIRYTLDGSAVTGNSPVYTSPIRVQQTTILRAKAFDTGLSPSFEATGTFAKLDDERSHYAFDERTNDLVQDRGRAQLDGDIVGAARTRAGWSGGAVQFDGKSGHVRIPTPSLKAGVTIAAWVYADRFDHHVNRDGRILSQAKDVWEQDHGLMLSTMRIGNDVVPRFRLRVEFVTKTVAGAGAAMAVGRWQHLVASFDGKSMRVYLDGSLAGVLPHPGNITLFQNVETWIGDNPTTKQKTFAGRIDELKLWDRALDAEEIRALGLERPLGVTPIGLGANSCNGVPRFESEDELALSLGTNPRTFRIDRLPPSSGGALLISIGAFDSGWPLLGARFFLDPSVLIPFSFPTDASGRASFAVPIASAGIGTRFVMQAAVFGTTACPSPGGLLSATRALEAVVLR